VSTWNFGEFELDAAACELRRSGMPIKIQRKPLDVLLHLVQHRDRTVPRSELLASLWPGVRVSEEALASALRDLRRALGDTDRADPIVETRRGHGYRFVAPVTPGDGSARAEAAPSTGAGPNSSREAAAWQRAFVDREDVMSVLRGALEGSTRGQTHVSFVAGPAGIGKTRAAEELVRAAEASGVEAHVGSCYEWDGATPYWPWLQVVRACVASRDASELRASLGTALPFLAWIAPELVAPGAAEVRADLDGSEARFRLFDATARFLRKITEGRPLLIVLEDLHWGDEATLLLLEFIVQEVRDARLHLLGTFRDVGPEHTLTRVLGASARRPSAERIDLGGLRRDSVRLLLTAAAQREPSQSFAEAVFAATGGNPFFVVELTRLVAMGALDPSSSAEVMPVPARVRDAIRLQLKRLPSECEALLALASVAGHEFHSTVLAHASSSSPTRTLELLALAEAAGVLTAAPDGGGKFSFVHDLTRQTIRQELRTAERMRLHRKMAEALEGFYSPDDPACLREIACHYAEAAADGVAVRAVEFSRRAAEQANAGMAFEDAVRFYDQALEALTLVPDAPPRLRCELLLSQAEVAWGTHEGSRQVQARFVKAATAARMTSSPELLARAALGRSGYGAGSGDYRDIFATDPTDIELLSEALDALGPAPSRLRAIILARMALAVRYANGLEAAAELAREAVEIGEQLGDVETLGTVLRYQHEVLSAPSYTRERGKLAERLLNLARRARSRPLELDALFFSSRAAFELGDMVGAYKFGVAAEKLAVTMRHPGAHFRSGIRLVIVATLTGKFEEAQKLALRFFERDVNHNLNARGTFTLQMAMFGILRGKHEEAIRLLMDAETPAAALTWRRHAIARERALCGQHARAKELFERAATDGFAEVANDHTRLGSLMSLADVCAELGDVARAEELYALMRPYSGMMVGPFLVTICQGAADRALGTLSTVLRRWDEANEHFASAVRLEEACQAPPLLAFTLQCWGAMLLQRNGPGDRDRARELLTRATSTAERFGMLELARRAEQLAASAGLSGDPSQKPATEQ
jgi:DNA-binding winged helix-turn-helix (wHTH) protein/tetratricopeptide (TPR) repeat protein